MLQQPDIFPTESLLAHLPLQTSSYTFKMQKHIAGSFPPASTFLSSDSLLLLQRPFSSPPPQLSVGFAVWLEMRLNHSSYLILLVWPKLFWTGRTRLASIRGLLLGNDSESWSCRQSRAERHSDREKQHRETKQPLNCLCLSFSDTEGSGELIDIQHQSLCGGREGTRGYMGLHAYGRTQRDVSEWNLSRFPQFPNRFHQCLECETSLRSNNIYNNVSNFLIQLDQESHR